MDRIAAAKNVDFRDNLLKFMLNSVLENDFWLSFDILKYIISIKHIFFKSLCEETNKLLCGKGNKPNDVWNFCGLPYGITMG